MDDQEKQKNYELAEKLNSEQNFAVAIIAGAIAMLLAAVAYGIPRRWLAFNLSLSKRAILPGFDA